MTVALGRAAVLLGFLCATWGVVSFAAALSTGSARYRRVGAWCIGGVVLASVLAFVSMQYALLTDDFSIKFVADNHSTLTPFPFDVATLWSALEGSILLWVLVLGGYLALTAWHFRARLADPLVAWAMLTMLVVCAFFFYLLVGPANPFQSFSPPAGFDGPGPNPLLQNHILMAFHPPMLYMGYVGFTVPFAFAIASLATGRVGEGWLLETRRWTLAAWGFLTVGIILGSWWAYEVLGWGGYWGWDPVENASFLPWLTGTAYLHSVMVQERRGMLRVWNLSLLCATFSLTILGTFITRSGVLQSVHAFTESGIGPAILGFFALTVGVTIGLIAWRGDELRTPAHIEHPISREGAFLVNNLLFAAFAFTVLLGTVFPLIVEAANGDRITVGSPFFNRMSMPIGMALLFVMAVAPVLPWRRASGELLRHRLLWPAWIGVGCVVVAVAIGNRGLMTLLAFGLGGFAFASAARQLVLAVRRNGMRGFIGRSNGGMIVHIGVVVIAVAIAASQSYVQQTELRLEVGQTATFAGHTFTYEGLFEKVESNKTVTQALVRVDGEGPFAPGITRFNVSGQQVGTPSVRTTVTNDVALSLLTMPEEFGGPVVIRLTAQPLIVWLWIGGGIMALGTLLSAWPSGRRPRSTALAGVPGAKVEAPAP